MYLIKRTDQRIVFRQQVIGLPVGDESLDHVIDVLPVSYTHLDVYKRQVVI